MRPFEGDTQDDNVRSNFQRICTWGLLVVELDRQSPYSSGAFGSDAVTSEL